ncbi:hypothetical protein J4E86_011437 [Alternaria arbusti]|uniref:uncharacterized protein n=1 Tax=Alternaria arbusti TaxID=232088 RepID=UPI00221F0DC1|nr:uncharacterized protein J4E86_011437 [Alternaria arbusti]KAI4934995.1 hypothetical protein J4E86_011437 [Alternaria arbusti]
MSDFQVGVNQAVTVRNVPATAGATTSNAKQAGSETTVQATAGEMNADASLVVTDMINHATAGSMIAGASAAVIAKTVHVTVWMLMIDAIRGAHSMVEPSYEYERRLRGPWGDPDEESITGRDDSRERECSPLTDDDEHADREDSARSIRRDLTKNYTKENDPYWYPGKV